MTWVAKALAWFSFSSLSLSVSPLAEIREAKAFHDNVDSYIEWSQGKHSPEALADRLLRDIDNPDYSEGLCADLMSLEVSDLFYVHVLLERGETACLRKQWRRYDSYLVRIQNKLSERYNSRQEWPPTEQIPLLFDEFPLIIDGHLPLKTVVLTFDDGPHPTRTPALLRLLADEGALAQFFLVGQHTNDNPDVVKTIHSAGHEVGCHSFTHPDMRRLPFERARKEVEDGFKAIENVLGVQGNFFRYPYGASTPALRTYLLNTSTTEFFWNIDTFDWKYKDPEFLLEYALAQVEQEGRGVILLHDIQPQTIAFIPAFLAALREFGYRLAIFRPMRPRMTPAL